MILTTRPTSVQSLRSVWLCILVGGLPGSLQVAAEERPRIAFHLSQTTQGLIDEVRPAVVGALREKFGEPASPVIGKEFPVKTTAVAGRAVYETHCLRCHGSRGDGGGPESRSLDPKPRDFRLGIYKWKSTMFGTRPTRHDLRETIRLGIPPTAMPAFEKLGAHDVDAVVEYIRWLSMAGEFELRLGFAFAAEGLSAKDVAEQIKSGEQRSAIVVKVTRIVKEDLAGVVQEAALGMAETWEMSELESEIVRPKMPETEFTEESVARGRNWYLSDKTQCQHCHGLEGKGDGKHTRAFWLIPGLQPETKYAEPGLHDEWGAVQKLADLNQGIFRGGDDPESLYRRIAHGIPGTQMPGYRVVLTDEDVWDLVHYLQSLRPEKLRGKATAPRRSTPPGTKE